MPAASMMRKAPSSGEPSSVLTAAKLPADAIIVAAIGGASRFARCTVRAAEPATDRDEWRLGPQDRPEPEGEQGREHDAGQVAPGGGSAARCWKPRAGECPAVPGR